MTSERMIRRVERLLDQADEAADALDWTRVGEIAGAILAIEPSNVDAQSFVEMVAGAQAASGRPPESKPAIRTAQATSELPSNVEPSSTPTSFANDRYQVSKFLGEGGKKRVYLAHDTLVGSRSRVRPHKDRRTR